MDAGEFRRRGHELVDWVADYLATVADLPPGPSVEPGWVRAQLPPSPPVDPQPWDGIVADLDRVIRPGLTHWQSGRWFAFFPGNTSHEAVLGELVAAGLGQQGMLWATSPVATELETLVCDWLADLLGLPEPFRSEGPGGGVLTDSASTSTFVATVAAREAATGGAAASLADLRAYASVDAHSSVEKACRLAGLGSGQLRLLPVDAERRLDPSSLAAAVAEDAAAGLRPFLAVSVVGTTSFGAVDPVAEVGRIAAGAGMWHHVDAAWAGAAGAVEALRPLVTAGLETADSYLVNPHKWLLAGMDAGALYVADRRRLTSALSIDPEYLRNAASESGSVVDYRDWGVALGRRFRALKLWFLMRSRGTSGLTSMVAAHVAMAADLAARVESHSDLELVVPCRLALVCVAHREGDAATQRLLDAVAASGAAVTHTRLDGRLVVRVSIGSAATEARHVDALWDALAAAT